MKGKVAAAMIIGGAIGIAAGLLAQPLMECAPVQNLVRSGKKIAQKCSQGISEMM